MAGFAELDLGMTTSMTMDPARERVDLEVVGAEHVAGVGWSAAGVSGFFEARDARVVLREGRDSGEGRKE